MADKIDLPYELRTLRGLDPPVDGKVKGGVVGELANNQATVRKFLIAVLSALLLGAGGGIAWLYAKGIEEGEKRRDLRQLRHDVDECLGYHRGKNWIPPIDGGSSDP